MPFLLGMYWALLKIAPFYAMTTGVLFISCEDLLTMPSHIRVMAWKPGYLPILQQLEWMFISSVFIGCGALLVCAVRAVLIWRYARSGTRADPNQTMKRKRWITAVSMSISFCTPILFALITSAELYNPRPFWAYWKYSGLELPELSTLIQDPKIPEQTKIEALIILGACGIGDESMDRRQELLKKVHESSSSEKLRDISQTFVGGLHLIPVQEPNWFEILYMGEPRSCYKRIAVFYNWHNHWCRNFSPSR